MVMRKPVDVAMNFHAARNPIEVVSRQLCFSSLLAYSSKVWRLSSVGLLSTCGSFAFVVARAVGVRDRTLVRTARHCYLS
jgi:hypothetical protein